MGERQELNQSENHPPTHPESSHSPEEIAWLSRGPTYEETWDQAGKMRLRDGMGHISQWKNEVEGVPDFTLKLPGSSNPKPLDVAVSGSKVTADIIRGSQYCSRTDPRSDMTSARHRETAEDTHTQRLERSSYRAQCLGRREMGETRRSCPRSLSWATVLLTLCYQASGLQS